MQICADNRNGKILTARAKSVVGIFLPMHRSVQKLLYFILIKQSFNIMCSHFSVTLIKQSVLTLNDLLMFLVNL